MYYIGHVYGKRLTTRTTQVSLAKENHEARHISLIAERAHITWGLFGKRLTTRFSKVILVERGLLFVCIETYISHYICPKNLGFFAKRGLRLICCRFPSHKRGPRLGLHRSLLQRETHDVSITQVTIVKKCLHLGLSRDTVWSGSHAGPLEETRVREPLLKIYYEI